MKTFFSLATLSLLPFFVQAQIDSKAFTKGATASISRIYLFKDKTSTTIDPTVLWSQFDATKRSSLIAVLPENSKVKVRVLAENTPDAALDAVSKITNSVKFKELDVTSALEFSRSVAQIKRSAAVESFRLFSYRISEMLNNDGTLNAEVRDLFKQLITAAESTALADAKASSDQAQVDTERQKNIGVVITQLTTQLKATSADSTKRRLTTQLMSLVK